MTPTHPVSTSFSPCHIVSTTHSVQIKFSGREETQEIVERTVSHLNTLFNNNLGLLVGYKYNLFIYLFYVWKNILSRKRYNIIMQCFMIKVILQV